MIVSKVRPHFVVWLVVWCPPHWVTYQLLWSLCWARSMMPSWLFSFGCPWMTRSPSCGTACLTMIPCSNIRRQHCCGVSGWLPTSWSWPDLTMVVMSWFWLLKISWPSRLVSYLASLWLLSPLSMTPPVICSCISSFLTPWTCTGKYQLVMRSSKQMLLTRLRWLYRLFWLAYCLQHCGQITYVFWFLKWTSFMCLFSDISWKSEDKQIFSNSWQKT